MPLLNYTTTIPADKTAGEVLGLIARSGAAEVSCRYEAGDPTGIAFSVMTPAGLRRFTLPVNAEAVQRVLRRQKVSARLATPDHAARVAWRILKDWVEAQLAIIQTEMVTLDQVMLPYMTGDDGQTVYEIYMGGQLALEAGTVDGEIVDG